MRQKLDARLLRFGVFPLLALLALLVATGFAAAQTSTPMSTAGRVGPHGMIPELEGIALEQLFDHFRGSQFTITDAQGNVVVYQMIPGTVAEVSANSVTLTPNGSNAAMTFGITSTTLVHATPAAGSIQAVVPGDKIVVMAKQGSNDAVTIMEHRMGMGMYHGGQMMGR